MSATEETRRLTPTERLHEVTMAAMARRPAEPESLVEITRNTKGYNFTVTVRGPDADAAYERATTLAADLEALYPVSTNGGGE